MNPLHTQPTQAAMECAQAIKLQIATGGLCVPELASLIDERTCLPQLAVVALAAQGVVDEWLRRHEITPSRVSMETLRDALAAIKAI